MRGSAAGFRAHPADVPTDGAVQRASVHRLHISAGQIVIDLRVQRGRQIREDGL
ncbi:hypothetical protein DPMN_069948 [Dreissena polymorpha]|uniref:Uncharacterized protein n=1 Tax=Dreissena polymorpha TaxID=45954 RepID=A0A9D3Z4J7_DREPO|nr:hypothetical protein DPMN_069948 [Dreissena polymorpha]